MATVEAPPTRGAPPGPTCQSMDWVTNDIAVKAPPVAAPTDAMSQAEAARVVDITAALLDHTSYAAFAVGVGSVLPCP